MIPIKSKYWHGHTLAKWFYGGVGGGEIIVRICCDGMCR
jgi:hypothetical protein